MTIIIILIINTFIISNHNYHYPDHQHNYDLGDQITCVRLLSPLLATGARGAERAVRIWNLQVPPTFYICASILWIHIKTTKLREAPL